jgi:hypothetical protein
MWRERRLQAGVRLPRQLVAGVPLNAAGGRAGKCINLRQPLGQGASRPRQSKSRRPAFTLSHLVINGADALDVSRDITGSVAYRRHGPIPQGLCLRLIYFPGEIRRSSFDHLAGQQVTADGALSFSFGSVGFSNPRHAGPLVVFLELCSESKSIDAPDPIIESNTLTALIFVQADKKGEH